MDADGAALVRASRYPLCVVRSPLRESVFFPLESSVPHPQEHAELLALYRRAAAEAEHKQGLIQTVARKGPKAIAAAVDTAKKAAKRRDSFAAKLAALGVSLEG